MPVFILEANHNDCMSTIQSAAGLKGAPLLGNTAKITPRVYTQIAANDLRQLTEANARALLPAAAVS